tara:strand:- start:152 stop:2923 length:2772 start_codon:yes stop_codon:yes gene_type:complete
MASLWTQSSGTILATLQERQTTTVSLPLENPVAATALISGALPNGMRLESNAIVGTPLQVARETTSTFVIRATLDSVINDRTFKIITQGQDAPTWVTKTDLLPVGIDGQYFILDSAPVDFQLVAIDADTSAGQTLEYFIGNKDGELPPGISLTSTGKLVGVVDPILAIEKASAAGNYDDSGYDFQGMSGYDWSVRSNNGYDSYFYDTTVYGLSLPTASPKKLNRYYQFTVSVSDRDTIARRTFRIYVVGDDFFRSDTTLMQIGTGTFTADISHLRTPVWITPRDFGYRRANNYVTLVLDIIDPNTLTGVVTYNLKSKNDDTTDSILPPGLSLDATTGEIAGVTPYQPAITTEYKFTINARRIEIDEERIQFLQYAYEIIAQNSLQVKVNKLGEYASRAVGLEFNIDGYAYKANSISTANTLYDVLNIDKPLHRALTKGTTIDLGTIGVLAQETVEKAKTFTIKLLGEIDSTIQWSTPENLGNISSNYVSTLSVLAKTTVPNATLLYSLESGTLPPGLALSYDGEIIGKINSFETSVAPGLTVFDSNQFSLDGNDTTVDRKYKFTVKAQDQFGYSAIQRQFTITVADPGDKLYSNLHVQPFMKEAKRATFINLINDAEIFLPEYIYRPNDPNFGLQRKIKMLAYAGIETKAVDQYVAAMAKNHTRKSLKFGAIKTAVAKTPGTNNIVYEVVYVEMIDPYESAKGNVRKTIKIKNPQKQLINSIKYTPKDDLYDGLSNVVKVTTRNSGVVDVDFNAALKLHLRDYLVTYPVSTDLPVGLRDGTNVSVQFAQGTPVSNKYRPDPANTITVDSNAISIDGSQDQTRYISNISHMRDAIRDIGVTEGNYLPLWMRTAQTGSVNQLGFVNAVPLVYCKPGTSAIIKNTLEFNEIDFTQYNFDIDRYVIDSTIGNSDEQYLLFANYQHNI